jgi:hypothetical protein
VQARWLCAQEGGNGAGGALFVAIVHAYAEYVDPAQWSVLRWAVGGARAHR